MRFLRDWHAICIYRIQFVPDLLVFKNQKEADMDEVRYRSVQLYKVLGNPLRRKILDELAAGPAHPLMLARRTGRVLCAVSRALGILHAADLVEYRTEGNGVAYALKRPDVLALLRHAEAFVRRAARQAVGPSPARGSGP